MQSVLAFLAAPFGLLPALSRRARVDNVLPMPLPAGLLRVERVAQLRNNGGLRFLAVRAWFLAGADLASCRPWLLSQIRILAKGLAPGEKIRPTIVRDLLAHSVEVICRVDA